MDLLSKFERDVSFVVRSQGDPWSDPLETSIDCKGLVSIGSNSLDPKVAESLSSSSLRIFLKIKYKEILKNIKLEDEVVFDGERYSISKIDLRGILPGNHKLRFEAILKR